MLKLISDARAALANCLKRQTRAGRLQNARELPRVANLLRSLRRRRGFSQCTGPCRAGRRGQAARSLLCSGLALTSISRATFPSPKVVFEGPGRPAVEGDLVIVARECASLRAHVAERLP